MAQPTEFEQVTYNAPDGAQMGQNSSTPIAFYGATPVARLATTTLDVSTNTATTSSAIVGFASAAEFNNTVAAVSTMQSALKRLGLIAS